jgi:hypothetical protein
MSLCRICDSKLHETANCPSWQSDLLLYHELSYLLDKESTSQEYEYAELRNNDAKIPCRFTPIRDGLQTFVYAGSHLTPQTFMPEDAPENIQRYFERYGSIFDGEQRLVAHTNLHTTFELLLEWCTRQLQRATTILAHNSNAIQHLRDDITTYFVMWAAMNEGCLIKVSQLPRRILNILKDQKIFERLHANAFLFLWLHPNRTTLGWAQIRQPDPTIVVLDVDHLQFSLLKDISIRILPPRYVANDPIRSPSYGYDASKRREQYLKYLTESSISLLVRQFSFLHWLKREQQAFSNTTVTFRPFHASQLLRSFESQNDSATVLTTLSHLDHHLATSQFEELVVSSVPPSFVHPQRRSQTSSIRCCRCCAKCIARSHT